ncbi:hypothetical protein [Cellulomonas sp. Y8]|uniref:hypothetical protein n=1 Tax=Cellulomonas sp. Y8 TaxID=2591145 RepID=UPI003D741952
MRTHSAARRAVAIAPALSVIGLTGLLTAGPAAAATNVSDGLVSLDPTCSTDIYDTSDKLCSYIKVSTSDFLIAGVPDATHEAVTVTLQQNGADIATGHPNVKYARGGGELYFVGVRPGTYTVNVDVPDGYKQAGDMNDAPGDSLTTTLTMQPVQGVLDSRTVPVKLTDADVPLAPLDVYVWEDTNANGRLDGDEASPDEPVGLELKNHESSNDGYVAQNSYGAGYDYGVRTYWYVPGDYSAKVTPYAYGDRDLVPLDVIDPDTLTGELTIPAGGTSLMIPVGERGTVVTPTDPETPTDPVAVAPTVTATTKPASTTTDTTAKFAFTADQDVTWTRAVDGAAAVASEAAFELTDLALGEHQVVVTATNAKGLTSAPVTIDWTVTEAPKPAKTVVQGGTVDVDGDGFVAGEDVEVWIHSEPVLLATVSASADGAVATTVTVPASIPAGAHRIELRGVTSGVSVWQDVTVTAAPAAVVPAAPADPAVVEPAAAAAAGATAAPRPC